MVDHQKVGVKVKVEHGNSSTFGVVEQSPRWRQSPAFFCPTTPGGATNWHRERQHGSSWGRWLTANCSAWCPDSTRPMGIGHAGAGGSGCAVLGCKSQHQTLDLDVQNDTSLDCLVIVYHFLVFLQSLTVSFPAYLSYVIQ